MKLKTNRFFNAGSLYAILLVLVSSCSDLSKDWSDAWIFDSPHNLMLSTSFISFYGKGSSEELTIIAQGTSWKIENLPEWLTVSKRQGTGTTTVILTCAANPSLTDARTAQFSVCSAEDDWDYNLPVSVYQPSPFNFNNGHEYVDLGLNVKWATCNVGASSPEDYGDYFAWGETTPKSNYNWSTYKWCNGSETSMTKYNTKSSYGNVDNKTSLELSDDAAYVNWGGSWRMPTFDEFNELYFSCTWTWTMQGGHNGYKVVSKSNGNSIFLPAAGYRYDTSLDYAGFHGYYWSGSLDISGPDNAWSLYFDSGNHDASRSSRVVGQSIRPVFQP